MDTFIKIYLTNWIILTLIGFYLIIKRRNSLLCFKSKYYKFLLKKWKIITLFIAVVGLSYIATLNYDPTWDVTETIIMSILTFLIAPYSVGTIYRYYRKITTNKTELYIAIILLLFISSWFYDAYTLLFLLGYYPPTAFASLGLSPFFYIFAGMMWSLDYSKDTGVIFVYSMPEWTEFKGDENNFMKIFTFMIPIILFMIVIFGYFIYINL